MKTWTVALSMAIACGLGCSLHHAEEGQGGETHFLQACEDSSECGALSCLCGVCTLSCESDGVCEAIDEAATCVASASICEDQAAPAEVCAIAVSDDADAAVNGDCNDERCVSEVKPLVMLLIDTSGSMERLADCACQTPSCDDCLPECRAALTQMNRWAMTLEALTGTFEEFSCVEHDREAPLATYDLGYYLPYFEPMGPQRADGMLDVYADRLRFGSATFDGWDTMLGFPPLVSLEDFDFERSSGIDGLWSYPPAPMGERLVRPDGSWVGAIHYPNVTTTYQMDTGIRNADASEGALLVAHDPGAASAVAEAIQADLMRVRPYGGTPTAAAFDDLYWYFAHDPAAASERANPDRERHVVFITDGYPDDDYRTFGCDCANEADGGGCGPNPPNDPAEMRCPYPAPEEAVRHLRCGFGEACDAGVVDAVHVISLGLDSTGDDEATAARLDAMASAGGTSQAWHTEYDGPLSLRQALDDVLRSIAED